MSYLIKLKFPNHNYTGFLQLSNNFSCAAAWHCVAGCLLLVPFCSLSLPLCSASVMLPILRLRGWAVTATTPPLTHAGLGSSHCTYLYAGPVKFWATASTDNPRLSTYYVDMADATNYIEVYIETFKIWLMPLHSFITHRVKLIIQKFFNVGGRLLVLALNYVENCPLGSLL